MNFPHSLRVYNRLRKKYASYLIECKPISHLPVTLQKMKTERWEQLLLDLKTMRTRAVLAKWRIGEKTIRRILEAYSLQWISSSRRYGQETSIEKTVRIWLQKQEVEFTQEYSLGSYFYDFRIRNLLIEVHGDYWHCNPQIYNEPISATQKRNLINDSLKFSLPLKRITKFTIFGNMI